MKPIFEFLDYRDYLSAFYEYHKVNTPGFSYRSFLQKAGISSPSFLKQVIDKKRNLTPAATDKFLIALNLNNHEENFFRLLVQYTHTFYNDEKQSLYRQLREIAREQDLKIIGEECYEYYEHWYTSALRELLTINHFNGDWKKIGQALHPSISAQEAKTATELLLNRGFLQLNDDGSYHQTNTTISTGHEVNSMAIRNFNCQCVDLASEAIKSLPKDKRHVTGITMGVSETAYQTITQEIEKLQTKILDILKEDTDQTKVVQLNTLLFPLSQEGQE